MTETLWRLLSDVRTEERARFGFFLGLAALLNAAQTVGLAGAEALLLSRLGAGVLPQLFVVASAVTVLGTLVYASVVGRARNDRLFVVLLCLASLVVLVGFAAVGRPWRWVPAALLCGYFVSQAVLLNHFVTFAVDYFDTLASKRLLPLITVGGSAGGAVGGVTAASVGRFAPELLVAAWAVVLAAAAVWLVAFSGALRRWRALGLEEADESSVQGIAASVRYARRSTLSRWLVASVLTMVVALFISQYLYSEILARNFPDTGELAAFLGIYLAASNLLEIAIELWGTPLLIRRFGVANTNLVHAGLTVVTFGVLAVDQRLAAAIGARLNREMLDNALAQPVRNLVYNALPLRLRGRMRAFLEGILLFSAMSLAGGLILVMGRPDPLWLCGLGGAAALLYLGANLRVRRAYLDALMEQLREGRLDLASIEGLGSAEVQRLGHLWSELLRAEATPAATAAELAPLLAGRGVIAPLLEGARHPHAGVRRACLEALASCRDAPAREALRTALEDPDPEVRLAALRSLGEDCGAGLLERLLSDDDPRLRSLAAAGMGPSGDPVLLGMVRAGRADEAAAALAQLPPRYSAEASSRLEHREACVRAAALERFARWGQAGHLAVDQIERALRDEAVEVRRAAVRAADATLGEAACAPLARALDDAAREIRTAASAALARRGDRGVEAAEPHLRARPWTVDAALAVLGQAGTPRSRQALRTELRRRVTAAWESLLSLHALAAGQGTTLRFLRAAHGDALARHVHLAFRVLRHLENADVVASVDRALRHGGGRVRADALELLSNLGDRLASGRLALLLESGRLEDRLGAAGDVAILLRPDEVLARAGGSEDRWVRMASQEGLRAEGEVTMERLLALKQVALFSRMSLDQLESVNRAMTVEQFARGEVVVREGERGDRFYLLLEGEIEIWKGWASADAVRLNRLRAVSAFGEMAVLHEQLRTATAVAAEESLLASLDGNRMKELIMRMPEISFVIFGELIERAQRAEERLRSGQREGADAG